MGTIGKLMAAVSIAAALVVVNVVPALAQCTRLAFSVNDYGKDGPTKDAKDLLDKHIAKMMSERGVSNYTVGPKTVNCELFIDLIVFDEYTCKAEATVCWGNSRAAPKKASSASTPVPVESKSTDSAAASSDKTEAPVAAGVSDQSALEASARDAAAAAAAAKDAATKAQAAADAAEAAAVAAAERVKTNTNQTVTGSTSTGDGSAGR